MALAVTPQVRAGRVTLEQRRDLLYHRLETGFRRIDDALGAGRDVTEWERLWISLLHEYETVCEDLDPRR